MNENKVNTWPDYYGNLVGKLVFFVIKHLFIVNVKLKINYIVLSKYQSHNKLIMRFCIPRTYIQPLNQPIKIIAYLSDLDLW